MRRILLCALFAALPALPAGAQILGIQGVLVEPRHPTPSDRIRLTVVGVESCSLTFKEPNYLESWGWAEIHIVPGKDCGKVPNPVYREFRHTAEIGPLPAGLHVAQIWVDNYYYPNPDLNWREIFEVGEDDGQLHLGQGGDFQASIHWSNPHDGSSGTGHARRLAQDSGAFWFFSPDNLEVTLKILDGRAVNGRWWVFIASMTDLQFEVEISRAGGPAKTYVQTAGANRNFIDVDASFEEGPPQPVCGPLQWSPEIILDPERPTAADPVHVEVAVCNPWPTLTYDGMEGNHILFNDVSWGWPSGGEPPPPNLRFTAETTAGPLAPGIYAVDFRMDKEHLFGRTFEVTQPSSQLRLRDTADSSFNVYVNLDSQPRGVGHGVPLTSESGYFWFFDPDNVELTVKILDGRAVNGKYWVFLSSMTDVAFTVEVEHCPDHAEPPVCTSQIYRSVQGVNRNFIDVDFPGSL